MMKILFSLETHLTDAEPSIIDFTNIYIESEYCYFVGS